MCYGLEDIASSDVVEENSYKRICSKFGVSPSILIRPREIDLLISLRASAHHPVKVKSIGHMTLYDGVFGKVLGGTSPDLQFVSSCSLAYSATVMGGLKMHLGYRP